MERINLKISFTQYETLTARFRKNSVSEFYTDLYFDARRIFYDSDEGLTLKIREQETEEGWGYNLILNIPQIKLYKAQESTC